MTELSISARNRAVHALRLLMVDDDEVDFRRVKRMLAAVEHPLMTVEWCSDFDEALEQMCGNRFDIYLLDLRLGPQSGIDLLHRANDGGCIGPKILLTGVRSRELDIEAMEAGASDYLVKDRMSTELLERSIRYVLERHRQLEHLYELLERVQVAGEEKDKLLRMAGHDLKNPLTVIKGNADLVRAMVPVGSPMTEDAEKLLRVTSDTAARMQGIIEDFLELEAVSDGRLAFRFERKQVEDVLRSCVEELASYADSKEIRLTADIDNGTQPVSMDERRIFQALVNLVGNAIKFSPPGSEVRVRAAPTRTGVRVDVIDQGPGLTKEDRTKVFGVFAKLSARPTGGESSTGLGLSIAKRMVEAHAGRIGVRNNKDVGATFWFELPTELPQLPPPR